MASLHGDCGRGCRDIPARGLAPLGGWCFCAVWLGASGRLPVSFEFDEAIEPGDVVLGRFGAVLGQRAGLDVEGRTRGPDPVRGQSTGELDPASFEEGQPGLGGQMPGEGET
jgi:hypothetical protein